MGQEGRLADAHVAAKNVPAVRSWVSLDSTGNGTSLDVDKHAIMRRVQIHARDLRIIDPLLSYPSAILGREKAIVLNLEHIKAIITAEEVLLRDPSRENVIPVVEEFFRRLPATYQPEGKGTGQHDAAEVDVSPFEFRALEVALEAICSSLDTQTIELENSAYPALDELTAKISSRNLDRVRKLKSAMTRLIARVQKVRDELERLLDDDNNMADLYLSRKMGTESPHMAGSAVSSVTPNSPFLVSKASRVSRASVATLHGNEYDVEELEMLLEAYFVQLDGTLNKLNTLREYVDDTEDYINFQLDNHRNQLIQLELFLSTCTVSFTFYSLVGAIFGMNIPYSWNENHEQVFKWVVGIGGMISGLILIIVLFYARYRGLIGT
ncbi:magnesium transporter MRS2-I-like [Canna indica]|uniref:Magnesium transporter n=1 Tax=Canna indica TaxID=4628 RepID=A0AAQ3QCU2_9LILI|nr:magnesium transporter MRS2-I-like [Canna indica]